MAEHLRRSLRGVLPPPGQPAWMRFVGTVQSGDPRASVRIDEVVYGYMATSHEAYVDTSASIAFMDGSDSHLRLAGTPLVIDGNHPRRTGSSLS